MENSNVTQFVLEGFKSNPKMNAIIFITLLLDFLFTLITSILLNIIICTDYRLHSPMYIFLFSLSFMETCGMSTVIPTTIAMSTSDLFIISRAGCFVQSYLYYALFSADFLLFAVMSTDRYLAVCCPLRYATIMRNKLCVQLVIVCLMAPCLSLIYPTVILSHMTFCGNVLNHFFCDSAVLMKLACTDEIKIRFVKIYTVMLTIFILIVPLAITAVSYCLIIYTIIRMKSETVRQKTFTTCVSHLTIVFIGFGSAIFIEIRPSNEKKGDMDKILNLVSTVLGPLLNPFIYTLRNQKVKDCIRDAIRKIRV